MRKWERNEEGLDVSSAESKKNSYIHTYTVMGTYILLSLSVTPRSLVTHCLFSLVLHSSPLPHALFLPHCSSSVICFPKLID